MVQFRNRALPRSWTILNNSSERRGTNPEDAVQLPSQRMHPLHGQSPAAATEGSRQRAASGQSVTVRARSRWAGRLAAGRYQVSMGRIKLKVRLAAAGIVRLDRPEGWAGNEGGQDADPPVHAAWAQDVLQLNGAEGIARRFTHMVDMPVIVRHQDRGALRLDHRHDQALCRRRAVI